MGEAEDPDARRVAAAIAGDRAAFAELLERHRAEKDWAIPGLDEAVKSAPRSSLAYLNRGLAYQRMGDLDRAIADFDRAIRYSPNSTRAYYARSKALRQRGDTKRADRDLRRAAELDPQRRAIQD